VDEQTREAHRRVFEKSLASFPHQVAEQARAEFPGSADCYRLKDDPGHYFLIAFAPPGSFPEYVTPYSDSLTAVLLHGTDSASPGDILVKVPFTQLVICDCGEWEMPEGITIEDYGIDMAKATWN
jgi:hypothetical protein